MAKSVHVVASKTGCNSRREKAPKGNGKWHWWKLDWTTSTGWMRSEFSSPAPRRWSGCHVAARARSRAGLKTAGFISGYRGSPLGMLDHALWRAQKLPRSSTTSISCPPSTRTSRRRRCWGTQQVETCIPARKVDGVFGIWYGKGPASTAPATRSSTATPPAPRRTAACWCSPATTTAAQSSSMPHQSEQVFVCALMPVLNPANVQEYLDFGLLRLRAVALLRLLGRLQGDLGDGRELGARSSSIPTASRSSCPTISRRRPAACRSAGPTRSLEQERGCTATSCTRSLPSRASTASTASCIDCRSRASASSPTGKAYLDVRQALDDLGIDDADAAALGLRIYKVGMTWPLEHEGVARSSPKA